VDDLRVEELVAAIERTIVECGYYVLNNSRLGLMCGVETSMAIDDPWTTEFVEAFAMQHNWSAILQNGAFSFYPIARSLRNYAFTLVA